MHGFYNLGNTCYFNSAIQCLLHTIPISEYIYKSQYVGDCKFTKLYYDLVKMYFSEQNSGCIDTTALLAEFQRTFPRFKMNEPHDSQDALFCIIDILEKEYSIIRDIIYGKKTQITISPKGKNTNDVDYSIQTLTVDDHVCKVSDLINKSMNWNTLEGYTDDDGNVHHVATTRVIFKKLQPVMIISFDKKSRIHLEDVITFGDDIKYSLQSCIIHEGVQWGGHYYSVTKFNDKWYAQDDENIFETTMKEVAGYYVLIYVLNK
jgi:ubiquitin C-terminal hydrolase